MRISYYTDYDNKEGLVVKEINTAYIHEGTHLICDTMAFFWDEGSDKGVEVFLQQLCNQGYADLRALKAMHVDMLL